jgi:hypothetical protein
VSTRAVILVPITPATVTLEEPFGVPTKVPSVLVVASLTWSPTRTWIFTWGMGLSSPLQGSRGVAPISAYKGRCVLGAHVRNFQEGGYRKASRASALLNDCQVAVGSGDGELAGALGDAVVSVLAVGGGVDAGLLKVAPQAAREAIAPRVTGSAEQVTRMVSVFSGVTFVTVQRNNSFCGFTNRARSRRQEFQSLLYSQGTAPWPGEGPPRYPESHEMCQLPG